MDFSKSVVRIRASYLVKSFIRPGVLSNFRGTGSGFCIDDELIVTNSHIVTESDPGLEAESLFITLPDSRKKYPAIIIYNIREIDLAVIKIHPSMSKEFWKIAKPLKLDNNPKRGDKALLAGYTHAGNQFGITKGRVIRPSFNNGDGLAYQVDISSGSGNSGGPCLSTDGNVIGVLARGTNEPGYTVAEIVPVSQLQFLLRMMKVEPKYKGLCALNIIAQSMDNKDISAYYGLDGEYGILVDECTDAPVLKEKDIILNIDGHDIYKDGFYYDEENDITLPYWWTSMTKLPGEILKLIVIRGGKKINLNYKCIPLRSDVHRDALVCPRGFLVLGGFIFTSYSPGLNKELENEHGASIYSTTGVELNCDVVFLTDIVSDIYNEGYTPKLYSIVTKVQDKNVKNIMEMLTIIEKSKDEYIIITLIEDKFELIFNRKDLIKQSLRINEHVFGSASLILH